MAEIKDFAEFQHFFLYRVPKDTQMVYNHLVEIISIYIYIYIYQIIICREKARAREREIRQTD